MQKSKNYFYLIVIIIGIILAIPITYYFLYSLPKYNAEKLELERQKYKEEQEKTTSQAQQLKACLEESKNKYARDFNWWQNNWECLQEKEPHMECLKIFNKEIEGLKQEKKSEEELCYKRFEK